MNKEELINGSKLFYYNRYTEREEYCIYAYGRVVFPTGLLVNIQNYDDDLKYIFNHHCDVIRVENPTGYEIPQTQKTLVKKF